MMSERQHYTLWREKLRDDPDYARELEFIREDESEIKDRFYRNLEFGTAGLRGVLGLGTNRMNVFTVRQATQGFANYLKAGRGTPSVAIAYDSRNCSELFARETACVFAANGVRVYLYRELMPTPALSFAVRELRCDAGVVITASHNPAKYNGYKAYGADGCQIGPEQAAAVLGEIAGTDLFDGVHRIEFEQGIGQGMISFIPEEFVIKYLDRVCREAVAPEVCEKAALRLVYTPLNGAGNRCVREIFRRLGVKEVAVVPEQEQPDGNFPTCPYPNPEMKETLTLGLALCQKTGSDLLLATDPDCDRVAVAVKSGDGYRILSGNELGVLLLDYLCAARLAKGTLPQKAVAVKSVVSTKLADAVAGGYGVELRDVLTGFKFIGEVILELEQKGEADRFILGFEESCGYLSGSYVRDKDAVNACLLVVEMASSCKLAGKSLLDRLEEIYRQYGIYHHVVENYAFEGADGMRKMSGIMDSLRENPPASLGGAGVTAVADYLRSKRTSDGTVTPLLLPSSNILEFSLDNGATVIVRPSGTEPKIKVYYSFVGDSREALAQQAAKCCDACRELIR